MVLMDEATLARFVRITINGFDENIRGKLALEIFIFAGTQKGWINSSKEEYNNYHCTYMPGTAGYIHARILASAPYFVKNYVIDSIKDYPHIWEEESCLIWNEYI